MKKIDYYGFNRVLLKKLIEKAKNAKNNRDFEEAVLPIAKHTLMQCEGFTHVEQGPKFQGTPFDMFGYKNGEPYVIELKASMKYCNLPGIVQRERMMLILAKFPALKIALLQIKLINSTYRLLYDREFRKFLAKDREKAFFKPIIQWLKKRMINT